ncbi:ABC transporter substrate-binding protein [Haloarchaeobius iranensis]|uniref:Peptide/nickel transport system substrate-binding protein n=1 Tax=Haloarchaeobius iranensis TaxID=996166 RepID=A0A1G9SMG3_9EURY|nr:ABC transporter substrate-binding protein [Haloarchaeobius iranensis]SDM36629.1 peptide/nickel transport system substrate-binding protein [Haloarchaeobius iranensis]
MTDNTSIDRRRFLKATGGTASAVAVAGCLGGGGEGDGTDTPEDTETEPMETATEQTTRDTGDDRELLDKTFQLINSTMSTLDPVAATDTASGTVIQNVFDALMNYPNGEIEVEPLLAADFEVSDDFTTYTFNIKEDAQFHNGDEVTAQDFVYSFERLAGSSNSRRAYFTTSYAMGIEQSADSDGNYEWGSLGATAVDDKTFELSLQQPFASTLEMLAYTSFSAVPEGIVGDHGNYNGDMAYEDFARNNPVGAGPFVFESWETNTSCDITRNEDYHGPVPHVAGVHWQVITDPDAAYNYGQNQNSDLVSMPTSQYDPSLVSVEQTDSKGREIGTYGPMRNGETVQYLKYSTINTFYIGLNAKNVDPAARKAMAYVNNQQEGVDEVFKGRGTPAYHLTPPGIYPGQAEGYNQHAEESYPYGYNTTDIESARQVMEDAGYGPNNKYEVTLTTYESDTWQGLGTILRDKLANAHVNLQLEEAPFSTLLNRGRNGNLGAYSLGWVMDWPAPDNFLGQLVPELTNTDQEGGAQGFYLDWDDSDTDAPQRASDAWDRISNNPAPTEEAQQTRNEAYVEMEEAMWDDMILLPAYHRADERMAYNWVDMPRVGAGGGSRQKLNNVYLNDRS